MLRRAGHDVELPTDAGFAGDKDPVHLAHCISAQRARLTRDHGDFEDLHELLRIAGGHHPGILVVRHDSNLKHTMKRPDIVRAIANLIAASVPIANEYIILNHWR